VQLGGQLDDRREPAMFSSELGQSLRVAYGGWIGKYPLDLSRPSQYVRESISEGQGRASARLLAELLAKALDAAGRIDQSLLTSEERMALRADVRMNLSLSGTGLERIAAGALHCRRVIFGMDVGFHVNLDVQYGTAVKYIRALA
jgi:hypothetical protein